MGRHKIKNRTQALYKLLEECNELHQRLATLESTVGACARDPISPTRAPSPDEGIPTKEEWLKSINDPNNKEVPINPLNPLAVKCRFHAYNPKTGKHYCEDKQIDPYVCLNRYQRMTFKGGKCYPKARERKPNHGNNRKTAPKTKEYAPAYSDVFKGSSKDGRW